MVIQAAVVGRLLEEKTVARAPLSGASSASRNLTEHERDKREPTGSNNSNNTKLSLSLTERRRGLHLCAPLADVGDQRARVGVPSVGHQQPEELRGPARAGGRAAQLAPAGRGAEGADLGDEGGRHSFFLV